jgi:hypothetical protein
MQVDAGDKRKRHRHRRGRGEAVLGEDKSAVGGHEREAAVARPAGEAHARVKRSVGHVLSSDKRERKVRCSAQARVRVEPPAHRAAQRGPRLAYDSRKMLGDIEEDLVLRVPDVRPAPRDCACERGGRGCTCKRRCAGRGQNFREQSGWQHDVAECVGRRRQGMTDRIEGFFEQLKEGLPPDMEEFTRRNGPGTRCRSYLAAWRSTPRRSTP